MHLTMSIAHPYPHPPTSPIINVAVSDNSATSGPIWEVKLKCISVSYAGKIVANSDKFETSSCKNCKLSNLKRWKVFTKSDLSFLFQMCRQAHIWPVICENIDLPTISWYLNQSEEGTCFHQVLMTFWNLSETQSTHIQMIMSWGYYSQEFVWSVHSTRAWRVGSFYLHNLCCHTSGFVTSRVANLK